MFKLTLALIFFMIFSVMIWFPPATYADGARWIKYSGNPVLSPTSNAWDSDFVNAPRVIFDGTIYRMWYVGGHSGSTDIGYANSTDGITWQKYPTFVLSSGPTSAWDSSKVGLGSVLWNGTLFLMWYQGSSSVAYPNGAIGLAISPDGISWTKYSGNPVLKPTEVDQKYIATPFVVRLNATYSMWYTAKNATDPSGSEITRILYATSFDGIKWFKWPTTVLSPSSEMNAWDSGSVFSPSVIFDGSNFGMWYTGVNQSQTAQIGYATSPDGATWTKSSDSPILTTGVSGSWDSGGVMQANVAVGNGFLLYYDGFTNTTTGAIGLAKGPQGFTIAEFPTPLFSLFLAMIVCAGMYINIYKHKNVRCGLKQTTQNCD